jgi:hypothetical protein
VLELINEEMDILSERVRDTRYHHGSSGWHFSSEKVFVGVCSLIIAQQIQIQSSLTS